MIPTWIEAKNTFPGDLELTYHPYVHHARCLSLELLGKCSSKNLLVRPGEQSRNFLCFLRSLAIGNPQTAIQKAKSKLKFHIKHGSREGVILSVEKEGVVIYWG